MNKTSMNTDSDDLAIPAAAGPPTRIDFQVIVRDIATSILHSHPPGLCLRMHPDGSLTPGAPSPRDGGVVDRPLRGSCVDLASAQRTVEAALLDWRHPNGLPLLAMHARAAGVTRDAGLARVRESTAQPGWWTVFGDDLSPGGELVESPSGDARSAAWAAWATLGCPRSARITVIPRFGAGQPHLFEVEEFAMIDEGACREPAYHIPAISRAESARDVPEGSDPIVLALHLECSEPERARSRVRAARVALAQYVLEERWSSRDTQLRAWVRGDSNPPNDYPAALTPDQRDAARAIAAFEAHGIGGEHGFWGGDEERERMSWVRNGAFDVRDVAAWRSAVSEIAGSDEDVTPRIAILGVFRTSHEDLEWPMAYALDRAYRARREPSVARAWCDVARAVVFRTLEPWAPTGLPVEYLIRQFGVSASLTSAAPEIAAAPEVRSEKAEDDASLPAIGDLVVRVRRGSRVADPPSCAGELPMILMSIYGPWASVEYTDGSQGRFLLSDLRKDGNPAPDPGWRERMADRARRTADRARREGLVYPRAVTWVTRDVDPIDPIGPEGERSGVPRRE